jgi:iron complex outermembrane receptor protein
LGFDLALRLRSARGSGEVTYFRNDISDFLFRKPVSAEEFATRLPEFAARFPDRGIGAEEGGGEEAFPIVESVAADTLLQGIEAHADILLTTQLSAGIGFDYVRASLKATDEPLPRIPPLRFRGGLTYRYNAFQAGGEFTATAKQDRVFDIELPTDGSQLLKLFAAYSFKSGRATSTITARLDNVTDELYRNHLSFIKELAPEMGRNVKVVYNVSF